MVDSKIAQIQTFLPSTSVWTILESTSGLGHRLESQISGLIQVSRKKTCTFRKLVRLLRMTRMKFSDTIAKVYIQLRSLK